MVDPPGKILVICDWSQQRTYPSTWRYRRPGCSCAPMCRAGGLNTS